MKGFDRAALMHTLTEGAQALSLPLSAEQRERLIDYLALLFKWNAVYNLTAVRDPMQMMTHHVLDSLAAMTAFVGAENVLDVGAGGGLRGMVLAIWAVEAQPDMRIAMIDTVHKKVAILTKAKTDLALDNIAVHTGRVEELRIEKPFDVNTSRAYADLADFVNLSAHLLAADGRFVAMKGVNPAEEIRRLPVGWTAREVRPLQVPGLQAERHVVQIVRSKESIRHAAANEISAERADE